MVGVGLYCEQFFLRSNFSGGALSAFIHLSLGKAGPFTSESHINVKALGKMQVSPNNYIDAKKQHPDNVSRWYPMSDPDPE